MSIETVALLNGYSIPGLMALPLFNISPKSFPGYKECEFLVVPELGTTPLIEVLCSVIKEPTEEQQRLLIDLPNTSGYISSTQLDDSNIRHLFRAMPDIEETYIQVLDGAFDKLYASETYKALLQSVFPDMFDRTWKLISMLSGVSDGKNQS